jgi:hypothetical protein
MAIATSERRRGASRRRALSASFTGRLAGTITCTRRCPQSGAGDTSSTKRSFKPSSVCRSANARFNARCTCRQNCRAFRSTCLPDDKLSDVHPPNAWANSGSTKSADPFGRRLRCFKTKLPAAHARAPGPYADTYVVAVNLVVVESDGSRPGRPDYLRGGEQARRHRAACNRGHGLLRCCVELKWRWLRSDQPKHYRATSTPAQIVSITHLQHDTRPARRAMVGLGTRDAISRPRARLCRQGAPGTVCPAKME